MVSGMSVIDLMILLTNKLLTQIVNPGAAGVAERGWLLEIFESRQRRAGKTNRKS